MITTDVEHVLVAGDDVIGAAEKSALEEHVVLWITTNALHFAFWFDNAGLGELYGETRIYIGNAPTEFLDQHRRDFHCNVRTTDDPIGNQRNI